jgi:hypothetical protein
MHYLASSNGKLKRRPKCVVRRCGISSYGVFLITGTPERGSILKQMTHVLVGDEGGAKFQLQGERLCYYPKGQRQVGGASLDEAHDFEVFSRFGRLRAFRSAQNVPESGGSFLVA